MQVSSSGVLPTSFETASPKGKQFTNWAGLTDQQTLGILPFPVLLCREFFHEPQGSNSGPPVCKATRPIELFFSSPCCFFPVPKPILSNSSVLAIWHCIETFEAHHSNRTRSKVRCGITFLCRLGYLCFTPETLTLSLARRSSWSRSSFLVSS